MPRAKQQTAFLGDVTVKILHGVPVEQAGWLIKALVSWIEDGHEPIGDEIPPECLGSWIAIRDESVRINESRKQQSEAGRIGGKAKGKRTESKSNMDSKVRSPSDEGERTKRAHAGEVPASRIDPGADFTPSYIVEDWAAIQMQAHNVGLTEEQLAAWRDYYAAQGWRFKPTAAAPMNRTEALASIRNWARAEKRLEIRDMLKRDPSKFAPPPAKGGIEADALPEDEQGLIALLRSRNYRLILPERYPAYEGPMDPH